MKTFVLIPGAGGEAWYWHRVCPLLEAAGHRPVPIDLPAGDPDAGLAAYVDATLTAVGDIDGETVVVGQSLGGFTAPVVAERLGAAALVFLAAMIPLPGETAGEWWQASGFVEAWGDQEMDDTEHFFHDLPPEVLAATLTRGEPEQTERIMDDPLPLASLPDVPTRGIAATNDRFFPVDFMERLIRDRLDVATGHLPALADPAALVELLLR